MKLSTAKIIPPARLLAALAAEGVSREHGARTIEKLVAEHAIEPLVTPTGRKLLSFEEAQIVSDAFRGPSTSFRRPASKRDYR